MSTNKATQSTNDKDERNHVAKWTVMVYFAADNDLEEEALADLKSMKKVGSTDKVNIVAQLDSRGRGNTFRFLLRGEQTTLDEDVVMPLLPEINTGDPRELTDFFVWGAKNYQAENYMLLLWGHGRGWEDLDNADRAAAPTTDVVIYREDTAKERKDKKKGQFKGGYSVAMTQQNEIRTFLQGETNRQKMGRCLRSQLERDEFGRKQIKKRLRSQNVPPPKANGDISANGSDLKSSMRIDSQSSIGFLTDQTPGRASEISQDALKMDELEFALADARGRAVQFRTDPERKIDILGMDACLMGMAEVCHQIQDHVDYLVASEDAILDEGWPYERILARLVNNPDISPEEFSVTIVREFLLHFREQNRDVTKSACNLSRSGALATAVRELANELRTNIKNKRISAAILASRAMAQSFYIKDYVDLHDFCSYLSQLCENGAIEKLCKNLMNVIHPKESDKGAAQSASERGSADEPFVLAYGFFGHRLRGSNGVSIYFPCFNLSRKYADLKFAEKTEWFEFLSELEKLVDKRSDLTTAANVAPGVTATFVRSRIKTAGGTPEKVGGGTPQIIPSLPPRRMNKSSDASRTKQIIDGPADNKVYQSSGASHPEEMIDGSAKTAS